jgi:hypothetical protein
MRWARLVERIGEEMNADRVLVEKQKERDY